MAKKATSKETKAYTLLVSMAPSMVEGEQALAVAKEQLSGAYDIGMAAAREAGDWPTFERVITRLEDNIRKNVDGLADAFRADKRAEPGKNGETHKVPSSVSTLKGRIKAAFANEVSLETSDGKPKSYNELRKDLSAIAQAKRSAVEESGDGLEGDDKVRHELAQVCKSVMTHAKKLEGAELAQFAQIWMDAAATAMQGPGVELAAAAESATSGQQTKAA